jgi:HPt (histidine-containing phosphotransfer) domain-containing protein
MMHAVSEAAVGMAPNPLRRPERPDFSLSSFPPHSRLTAAGLDALRPTEERTVISTERLEELKAEVGEDDFVEIVALFIAESDGIVGRLGEAPDPGEAEELLHALKGSALNLGFDALATLCRQGEGQTAGTEAWGPRVDRVIDVYEQSKARLSALA